MSLRLVIPRPVAPCLQTALLLFGGAPPTAAGIHLTDPSAATVPAFVLVPVGVVPTAAPTAVPATRAAARPSLVLFGVSPTAAALNHIASPVAATLPALMLVGVSPTAPLLYRIMSPVAAALPALMLVGVAPTAAALCYYYLHCYSYPPWSCARWRCTGGNCSHYYHCSSGCCNCYSATWCFPDGSSAYCKPVGSKVSYCWRHCLRPGPRPRPRPRGCGSPRGDATARGPSSYGRTPRLRVAPAAACPHPRRRQRLGLASPCRPRRPTGGLRARWPRHPW